MADALARQLLSCGSLEEFRRLCSPLGLYAGRRFMNLELDVVNRCNLRCVMCFHSLEATRSQRTVYLAPETFAAVAARILPHAHRLTLSLGNEPLLSPHFVPILRLASSYHVDEVTFFTNGLLLDDRAVDAVIECGVTMVCVSVDAATRTTYEAIRRDGDFDRLLANMERLVARRRAADRVLPRLRLEFVMMQRNVHELLAFVELAARLGADELCFRHVVSFEGLDMEHESLTTVKALSNYWLDRALAAAATLGVHVRDHPAPFDLGAAPPPGGPGSATQGPFRRRPYCPYPFFHVSMGPNGEVLPCPHSHGEAPYGHVGPDAPIDTVWLGPRFMELRRRILEHDPPDMCRRCPFLGDRHPDVPQLFVTRRN